MTKLVEAGGRRMIYAGEDVERSFGFAEAVQCGDTIWVSGQIGLDENGELASPAPVDEAGRPMNFDGMKAQMRRAYACAAEVLAGLGASLGDVVSETLFVLDVPAAFAVAGPVRKEAYGTDTPRVASNIFGISGLAVPGQLIEIGFVARVTA